MLSRAAGTPEGLAGQPQIGDHGMPFRARIMAAALPTIMAAALPTASFLLAPSALLPAASFGSGFRFSLALKLVNRVKKLR